MCIRDSLSRSHGTLVRSWVIRWFSRPRKWTQCAIGALDDPESTLPPPEPVHQATTLRDSPGGTIVSISWLGCESLALPWMLCRCTSIELFRLNPVSYTHLTLPTI